MKSGLVPALALAAVFASQAAVAQSQDRSDTTGTVPAEITVSAQRAYLDPTTGRLTDKPPPGAEVLTLSPQELNMISTSHEGLVQRPHPSGWRLIDLRGRFRHMAVAKMAEDGSVEVREVAGEAFLPSKPEPPNIEDRKEK